MKGMAALAFGLVAVSCNKSDIFNPYQQQEENQKKSETAFTENVMDGQAIDANQTWSTANAMEVSVTPSATGTLKIYTANPIGNVVAPLYTANVTAGAQTTFTVTKPADVQALYATVYKAEGQIVNLQAFDAIGSKAEVNFNSTTGNRAALEALTAAGAQVNAQDREGRTALMALALTSPAPENLNILLRAGASPSIRDKNGLTARDYLRRSDLAENEKKKQEYARVEELLQKAAEQENSSKVEKASGQ